MLRKIIFLSFLLLAFHQPSSAQKKKKSNQDYVITLSTEYGDMIILLYDDTPKHKENFIKLATQGYYDSTTFHRIINDFMIQGGDPNSKDKNPDNDGMGNPGYTIPNEIKPELKHKRGAVAAARIGDSQNPERASNGSQFYIVENHEGTPHLDNAYTVFGQVIKGLDVIDKIAEQPADYRNRPVKDIRMKIRAEKMKKKKIIQTYDCESFYTAK
jgi:cyclophilin family peptidyl-prolyl cis-trans isomerase